MTERVVAERIVRELHTARVAGDLAAERLAHLDFCDLAEEGDPRAQSRGDGTGIGD